MKNCYNCKYYGKCLVSKLKCEDWEKYDMFDKEVVLNIQAFNTKWVSIHKKFWWPRLNETILKERQKKADVYLSGKDLTEWLKEQEELMTSTVIQGVINEGDTIGKDSN